VSNREELQFEEIYNRYAARIHLFLLKLCGDESAAEELTQETFFQAFSALHRYRGECSMFTWLAAIGKNVFFNYLRKSKRELLNLDLCVLDLAAPPEEEPGYRISREVEIARVRQAIRDLPKKYYDVLVLRVYARLPYAEIGAKLGISENSAKVLYFRAKNHIREVLLDE